MGRIGYFAILVKTGHTVIASSLNVQAPITGRKALRLELVLLEEGELTAVFRSQIGANSNV